VGSYALDDYNLFFHGLLLHKGIFTTIDLPDSAVKGCMPNLLSPDYGKSLRRHVSLSHPPQSLNLPQPIARPVATANMRLNPSLRFGIFAGTRSASGSALRVRQHPRSFLTHYNSG
jgi:hypothetical protein